MARAVAVLAPGNAIELQAAVHFRVVCFTALLDAVVKANQTNGISHQNAAAPGNPQLILYGQESWT